MIYFHLELHMENQINIGNQNTQQIGQNPVNQPIQIPKNSKVNYWMISTILLIVILVLGGFYTYKITSNQSLRIEQLLNTPTTSQNVQPSPIEKLLSPAPTNSNQQFKTYDGKFISFRYSTSWYVWSYGRGVSLDYFQINSMSQTDEQKPNRVIIAFDIQGLGYTEGQTLDEQKKRIEGFQKENLNPNVKYVISERKIDGLDALVYELTITNSSSYTKTIWVKKNNVKYIITMSVFGETQQARDSLVNQYKQDFENILNSVKLKYVDPAEVEKLGNHPD